MIQHPGAEIHTLNEKTETIIEKKWTFEIFYGDCVNGIRQTFENGSGSSSILIGFPLENSVRIELMNGERVTKLTFSGLY